MTTRDWSELEQKTRAIATLLWQRPAVAEEVAGVRLDCVLRLEPDYWVVVEVSKSDTLDKLRVDLAKLISVRTSLQAQQIATRCYFVCATGLHPSIRETAKASKVTAMSFAEFATQFFDFPTYYNARIAKPFGSAVDPITGALDPYDYVPVRYARRNGLELGLDELVGMLATGKKVLLTGPFGTGKSRAFREIYLRLAKDAGDTTRYPIAINLRESWGLLRASEIVRRHFDDLGLSSLADSIIRIYDKHSISFLLDGFDELGSQTWSDDPRKLKALRAKAVVGVKELLANAQGGAIISGRDHYFNDDKEMLGALGLSADDTEFVRCRNEFTPQEMDTYLRSRGKNVTLPTWLPRRPLICQVIADLPTDDLDRLSKDEGGDPQVCRTLIEVICSREARISAILEPKRIQLVMQGIARGTRHKHGNVGPISVVEINKAFENVVGTPPNDESAIMLQRLPGLGRVSSENSDREFVDDYILEGLRAIDLFDGIRQNEDSLSRESWVNPLHELGQEIMAAGIDSLVTADVQQPHVQFVRAAKQSARLKNRILAADVVGSLLRCGSVSSHIEFGFELREAHFGPLDCSEISPTNLVIDESVIEDLYLPAQAPQGFVVRRTLIALVHRVSAATGLPPYIQECEITDYQAVSTVAQIKAAELRPGHQILVALVKKTFFQKGGARKEEALTRGLGAIDGKLLDKILKLLVREKILREARGDEGRIYIPERAQAHRMRALLSELQLSKDALWTAVEKMSSER